MSQYQAKQGSNSLHGHAGWRGLLCALTGCATLAASTAMANPSGMQLIAGSATQSTSGNTLQIDTKGPTVLEWQSFTIDAGERTHFNTGNPWGRVLNRVTGPDASFINGALTSTGSVFLINANGIAVGGGAVVNTAALVLSTLNVDNNAFMQREPLVFSGSGAQVTNNGSISVDRSVALIGSGVSNAGSISAGGGDITLAAGSRVSLDGAGFNNVFVEVPSPSSQVSNSGTLVAGRGAINLIAAIQSNTGTAESLRLILDDDGNPEITIDPEEPVVPDPDGGDSEPVDPPEPPDNGGNPPTVGVDPDDDPERPAEPPREPAIDDGVRPDPEDPVVDGSNPPGGSPSDPPREPSTDGAGAPAPGTPGPDIPRDPQLPSFIVDLEPANLNPLVVSLVTQTTTDLVRLQESANESETRDTDVEEVAERAVDAASAEPQSETLQCRIM